MDDSFSSIDSNSEEADQKIVRHTLHCIKQMYNVIVVQSIDTDVLVLLLAYVAGEATSSNRNAFHVFFKLVTSDPTWYDVVAIIKQLGIDICKALPFFYAFTGCDTVSSFSGKGKCTFFDAWMKSREKDQITETFTKLGNMPQTIKDEDVFVIESLVKLVYYGCAKGHKDLSLNALRKKQFTQSISNDMRKIAPSSDALYMHILRATHTAGFEWVQCLHNISVPNPSVYGYILKEGVYIPKWLRNPSTFNLSNFVETCKCKTAQCKSCKCAQLDIPCLPLCHCNRNCNK